MALQRCQTEFEVSLYGGLVKYNDVLSKTRCRIFYKYGNRNGTYITDEFADKLIASLPYTPMKGIFEKGEFEGHGERNAEGKIYGIVPETTNFAWEKHLDRDGIEREYACCDVLVFSELYAEANAIVGKGQSMELFPKTLKWHKAILQGQRYIVFDDGCFFGLQVLGNDYEPCFEGAAFYSLRDSIEKAMFELEKLYEKENTMSLNFRLSDSQKHDALFNLLNPDYNEAGGWMCDYGICDVWDDYALCFKYADGTYERAYYTKNDEDDSLTITSMVRCYVMDLLEAEKNTVETLRALNGNNFELVSDELSNAHAIAEQNTEFSNRISELEGANSTLSIEKSEFEAQVSTLTAEKEALEGEKNTLNEKLSAAQTYCAQLENEKKEAVFAQYTELLGDDVLESYREKMADYSIEDLDMRLAYELKKSNMAVFTKAAPQYLPKDNLPKDGIEAILSKYPKN